MNVGVAIGGIQPVPGAIYVNLLVVTDAGQTASFAVAVDFSLSTAERAARFLGAARAELARQGVTVGPGDQVRFFGSAG